MPGSGYWRGPSNEIYRACVNTQSLRPDEIRAAAETHSELGPDYQPAVIESFLEKVGREIDARVDARVEARTAELDARRPPRERSAYVMVVTSLIFGIPLSGIAVAAGRHPAGLAGLLVIWIAIAVINVAYAVHLKGPEQRK